jgi:hypothetical protein
MPLNAADAASKAVLNESESGAIAQYDSHVAMAPNLAPKDLPDPPVQLGCLPKYWWLWFCSKAPLFKWPAYWAT